MMLINAHVSLRNSPVRCSHSVMQCIYHLREAHEIFVTGLEFAPSTTSRAVVGPNVDFTLFSISADSQIKAHQVESRRMFLSLCNIFDIEIVVVFRGLYSVIVAKTVVLKLHCVPKNVTMSSAIT